MEKEINRLKTFNSWPLKDKIKVYEFVQCGFFYTNKEDVVKCNFCGVEIGDWNGKKKPLAEHIRKSPKCPFVIGQDVGNILIKNYEEAKRPRMSDLNKRLSTFRTWDTKYQCKSELSIAGFYYAGIADVVICFYCGGSVGNWEIDDDPWEEHKRHFPNCFFLKIGERDNSANIVNVIHRDCIKQARELYSLNDIEKAIALNPEKKYSSVSDLYVDIINYKTLIESEKKKLFKTCKEESTCKDTCKEESTCKEEDTVDDSFTHDFITCNICMYRQRKILFQPCGHIIACVECSNKLFDCPICRKNIEQKLKLFFS